MIEEACGMAMATSRGNDDHLVYFSFYEQLEEYAYTYEYISHLINFPGAFSDEKCVLWLRQFSPRRFLTMCMAV